MITDAELLLGVSRHLSTYSISHSVVALDALGYAGRIYEISWRLRGSGVNSPERCDAIAIEAAVTPRELRTQILPSLEALGWIDVRRDSHDNVITISEHVPPETASLDSAQTILSAVQPSDLERAALSLLRATLVQPLERTAAAEAAMASGTVTDEDASEALAVLVNVGLVREVTDEGSGRVVVFNPNIWVGDELVTSAALKTEDAKVRTEVGALIEEIAMQQGMPQALVQSTAPRWIDFAVAQGLVQRSVVQTNDGTEQSFLFTPHLSRDPFTGATRDASGHVRQLVGSMIYAATFPAYKLRSPRAFVRALIRDGEAGDASPIGSDYPMLETGGIVKVVPGSAPDKFRLTLLQADVAEEALTILDDRGGDSRSTTGRGLRSQKSYVHIEKERARLATDAPDDGKHRDRLVAALRETTAKRSFDG
jgi:hypothetical protein